jgi:hypothetical protein
VGESPYFTNAPSATVTCHPYTVIELIMRQSQAGFLLFTHSFLRILADKYFRLHVGNVGD